MSSLFSLPKTAVYDSSGDPMAGATLYFYANASSTPQAVYSDALLNTSLGTSVTSDAYGVFPAIHLQDLLYRVALVDASGVSQWTEDDVGEGAITAAAVGAALYPQTATELAAAITPTDYSYPPGNVKRYGALGDSVSDDTAALQSAFAANAGVLLFPAGTYLVNDSLTVPSASRIEFEPGSRLMASANSVTFFTTTAFTSGVSIKHATLDGGGFTGVTGFDFTSLQLNSEILALDLYRCETGIIFRSGCVGVRVDNPSAYRVANPIVCMTGTNALTILSPNFDNTVDHGGTGAGVGVYVSAAYNLCSTTQIFNGYIQGYQYGVHDKGFSTSVIGTYFERCSDAAVFLDGSKSAYVADCYHFAFNDTCMVKGAAAYGAHVSHPQMLKSTATGGVYDFDATNVGCTELHSSDGFSNTDLGTTTGILPMGISAGTFTPVLSGASAAGTATYSVQAGTWRQFGNRCEFTVQIAWTGHTGSGDMVISGLPVAAGANFATETFLALPDTMAFTGPLIRGFISSATPYLKVAQISTAGVVANLAVAAAGGLTISGSYSTT